MTVGREYTNETKKKINFDYKLGMVRWARRAHVCVCVCVIFSTTETRSAILD